MAEKRQAASLKAQRENAQIISAMSQVVPSFDSPISFGGLVLNNSAVNKIILEHCEGQFLSSGRLADSIMTDSRISSLMDIAFSSVVQIMVDEEKQIWTRAEMGGQLADECLAWWKKNIWDVLSFSVLEEANRDVELMGYYISQIRYDSWKPRLERWHPSLCYYNKYERNFRVYSINNPNESAVPGLGKWVVYSPYSEYLCWLRGGITRLASLFLLKLYCRRDWGRYGTVYGNQIKTLDIPFGATPEQKSSMIRELQNMQSESIIPQFRDNKGEGFKIGLLGPAPGTADVFEKLMAYCDKEEAIYLLGQDLTSDGSGGAYKSVDSIWDATTISKARIRIMAMTKKLIPQVIQSVTKVMWGTDKVAPTLTYNLKSLAYQTQSAHSEQNRDVQRTHGTQLASQDSDG